MAIDLFEKIEQVTDSPEDLLLVFLPQIGDFSSELVNGVRFKMRLIKGREFIMGGKGINSDSSHEVIVSDFFLGETVVTQELWNAVMGKDGNSVRRKWSDELGLGNDYPVYCVSYYDILSFINKLNEKTKKTFRLPTDAEWEFAAQGGTQSQKYRYSGSDDGGDVAWFKGNSGNATHPVKEKKTANELGLYDMSGNVWEWCDTKWRDTDCGTSHWEHKSDDYVLRGGSWGYDLEYCLITTRLHNNPENRSTQYGFRLAMSMEYENNKM